MRWPIRNQILFPFAAVLAVAVGTIALTSSWLAVRREERETFDRLRRVVETLDRSTFPYTTNVLAQMRGLSGAEFVAFDAGGHAVASTLRDRREAESLAAVPVVRDVNSLARYPSVEVSGTPHLAAHVRTVRPGSLLVLYPERRLTAARWEAAWPPLAVGAATAAVMVVVAAWLSRRVGRRVDAVRGLFARIADGSFEQAEAAPPRDELHDLVLSANRLSERLRGMRETIGHTERVRLLGQLAGGLAHQLRNSLTGARMAVQLHQRHCTERGDDLDVALLQLSLTEEQVKGLLALGRREESPPVRGTLGNLLREVERLVGPACRHARIAWECAIVADAAPIEFDGYDRLRSALLNLVLNAIEAAGPSGSVVLSARCEGNFVRVAVSDDGPGPPKQVRESIFTPFITTKPDGIGLGLALAHQTAEEFGGMLSWERRRGHTIFTVSLPAGDAAPAERPAEPTAVVAAQGETR